jgi:hypothetical protein
MVLGDVCKRDCWGSKWYVSNQENSCSTVYRHLSSNRSLFVPFTGIVAGWGNLGAGMCPFTIKEGSNFQILTATVCSTNYEQE